MKKKQKHLENLTEEEYRIEMLRLSRLRTKYSLVSTILGLVAVFIAILI